MLKKTSIWLEDKNLKLLARIGVMKGGLKPAQLIRIAIQEYVEREREKP